MNNLRRLIYFSGVINSLSLIIYTFLTYGLFPTTPLHRSTSYTVKFSESLADTLFFLPTKIRYFLEGRNIFTQPSFWLVAYLTPILISTLFFLLLLNSLSKQTIEIAPEIPRQLMRWAVAFSVILVLALPLLVIDYWYSLGWGRMVMDGINPHYSSLVDMAAYRIDLPIDGKQQMVYGPLLSLILGGVMGLAGGGLWQGAFLYKLLLLSGWIGSLWLIFQLLQSYSPLIQSIGILIWGWLPIGLVHTVAEGHNDILMVFFMLLWLYGLKRNWKYRPRMSLVGSILVKYISAPLFFLDLLDWYFKNKKQFWYYAIYAGIPLLIGIGISAIFLHSFEPFEFFSTAANWHYYGPADAIRTLFTLAGLKIPGATLISRVIFFAIFIYYLYKYLKDREMVSYWTAALAIMTLFLFGINRRIWPWYLIWVLGFAALTPGSLLSRWVVGVSLLMPFPILLLVMYPSLGDFQKYALPALLVYSLSLIWLYLAPARWFIHPIPSKMES